MNYFPGGKFATELARFVGINRDNFVPKKSSRLCSVHFDDSCFEHKPVSLMDATREAIELKNGL